MSTDACAIGASASLVILLFCCWYLKYSVLVETTSEIISASIHGTYLMDSASVLTTLFGTTIGLLVLIILNVIINLSKAKVLPVAMSGSKLVQPPGLDVDTTWHVFISHVWGTGQDQARVLWFDLSRLLCRSMAKQLPAQ